MDNNTENRKKGKVAILSRESDTKSLDIRSSGTVDLEADVNAHLNELEDYIFRKTRISCRLSSNRLSVRMPSENLSAMLRRPEIKLSSAESSINLSLKFCNKGLK